MLDRPPRLTHDGTRTCPAAAHPMVYTVETPVERLSWTRTVVVAIAAAGFLFVAEPIAAFITVVFAAFSPGCGSGGDPNSCPSHPSDAAVYVLVVALACVDDTRTGTCGSAMPWALRVDPRLATAD